MERGLRLAALAVLTLAVAAPVARAAVPVRPARPAPQADADLVALGAAYFQTDFTPADGLGPLFNARSCLACHSSPESGGAGPGGLAIALRVGRLADGGFDSLEGRGGPVARSHSVAELGLSCALPAGIPPQANVTSVRNAPSLFGLGLIDAIPDEVIAAGAVPFAGGVHGRPNLVPDATGQPRVGRFGWKADVATLELFVAGAFRNELGLTNPLAPTDFSVTPDGAARCPGENENPEDDGTVVHATVAYVASLVAPAIRADAPASYGAALFRTTGCAACHTASLRAGPTEVPLYSDLLLHDMGPSLDDGVVQGEASGRDWRTTPLWGLSQRQRFLHDGRARTILAAIRAHGGEAEHAARTFADLTADAREALLTFLASL